LCRYGASDAAHPNAENSLTIGPSIIKIPAIRAVRRPNDANTNMSSIYSSPIAKQPTESTDMGKVCRHPRVRVVAREEDVEFVECQECGDVFDSSEFRDMAIEENIKPEEA